MKRKRKLNEPDGATRDFRERLNGVQLPQVQDWTVDLLRSEEPRVKIPVSSRFVKRVEQSDYASVAPYLEASEHPAELLEERLEDAMTSWSVSGISSEMDVHTEAARIIDSIVEATCDGRARRDKSSGTTAGRPDVAIVTREHQVIMGEYKTKNLSKAKDDCLKKTPFDAWGAFFGNLPFVFAYAMSGSDNGTLVDFGVLQPGLSDRWTSLSRTMNFETDRASVVVWVLRIVPFLYATANYLDNCNLTSLGWRLERSRCGPAVGRSLSLYVMENKVCVRKAWTFGDTPSAQNFASRLEATYATLGRNELVIQLADNTKIAVTSDNNAVVRGYFVPHGFPLTDMHLTADACRDLAEQLLRLLRYLRDQRVIHHDLRPENIICTTRAFQQNSKFLAIDFDDAVIVPEGAGVVSGCSGLDALSHAPNINQPHSFEVDVWGVGFILQKQAPSLGQLGPEICRDYEKLDLDDLQCRIGSAASPRS